MDEREWATRWNRLDRFTEFEDWSIKWLVAEQHTPTSASLVLFRSPGGLVKRAAKLGVPFGQLRNGRMRNGRSFELTVSEETYIALANIGAELELTPSRLTRIILTATARRNLWSDVLALQREMP